VKPLTMLVTPDGKWVFPNTAEFFAAIGDPNPDYDAIAFAVKNLGFIKWQAIEQSIIEIDLHPRNVELAALLAVQQQLLASTVRLFRIKYFDTSWQSEISSSAEHTIDRLSELCAPVYTPPATDRFIAEKRDLSELFEDPNSNLVPLAQKWRVSFGQFDSSIISLAVRCQLLTRLMIVGVNPRDPEPVFRFVGDGHRWLGGDSQFVFLGEKIVNQPDKEYGEWVAEFYKSVASTGQPRYDLVTAWLRYEDEEGSPRRLVQYQRLLLPWKTPSNEMFVTLCSDRVGTGIATRPPVDAADNLSSMKLAKSS
jgi:hypothetical protein